MLVLSVFAGLAYRLIVAAPLPWFASYPIELLGRPFQPLVYLIGGFGFVGAFDSLTSLPAAVLPLAVVALRLDPGSVRSAPALLPVCGVAIRTILGARGSRPSTSVSSW